MMGLGDDGSRGLAETGNGGKELYRRIAHIILVMEAL
jgi:hypothetical protein